MPVSQVWGGILGGIVERNGTVRPLCAIAAVLLILTGCGDKPVSVPAPDRAVTPLRVALFPASNTLPVHIAQSQGIFESHGLAVTITEGQDLPVFMAAQMDGQYDVAMNTPTLVLVGAERGLDIQIVASTSQQTRERPNAVWISRDDAIRTVTDLRGKTIAVPSLTGIITDSMSYLLQRNGLARNEVRFVQTPFPAMGDQLQAGRVDAVVATLPFSTAIAARGFRVHDDVIVEAVLDASGGTVDEAITTVWTVPRSLSTEHPDTISAWRNALREAIFRLDADEKQARAAMAEWLKMPADIVARAPLPDWTVDITPQQLEPYVDIARAGGSIDSEPDVKSLVWQGP